MKYIQCPENMDWWEGNSIFLAGGITNCPNWQIHMAGLLSDTKLIVVNPKRVNFENVNAEDQIKWEFNHLRTTDAILFWFPKETLCPITLFEYGKWISNPKYRRLFVGCHPDYERKLDLIIQTRLEDPNISIVHSLEDLAEQVKLWQKSKFSA